MSDQVHACAAGELRAALSNAIVQVTAEYTGRGPTRARATMDGDWIFVTLIDTLTKGERRLGETGRVESVRSTRREYQDAMRDAFKQEVERLTGRTVVAFLSDNHVEPDVAIEAFLLEPEPEPEPAWGVSIGA